MPQMEAQREVWAQTLVELGAQYPRLVVLDGDLANSTRAEVFEEAYPDRFLEMGIAEQNMVGVAAGLATVGFVPWLSSFAVFLTKRSIDQFRQVVAQPGLNVKLAGHYSGLFTARTGKTHQAVEDITVFRAMPHVTTVVPADGVELRQAMRAIMQDTSPTYVRLLRDPLPNFFDDSYAFELGKAVVAREGRDVTIVTTGAQLMRAVEAADQLQADGIEAHILHVPTIKPLDENAIVAAADRTGLVVTTEEHTILGGLGGAVAEVLGERRPTWLKRHGLRDTYGESGSNEDLIEKYGLSSRHIANACRELIASSRGAAAAR